jgi:hypothetical protein
MSGGVLCCRWCLRRLWFRGVVLWRFCVLMCRDFGVAGVRLHPLGVLKEAGVSLDECGNLGVFNTLVDFLFKWCVIGEGKGLHEWLLVGLVILEIGVDAHVARADRDGGRAVEAEAIIMDG